MSDPKSYSLDEAIDRLYRILRGDTLSELPESLPPPRYSINEALSRLAELLNGSMPGETATLPTAITVPSASLPDATTTVQGVAELATVAEAEAGTDTTRITTPQGVLQSIYANAPQTVEFGEIYNYSTGTAVVQLSSSWTKVTGSFQGNGYSSTDITPDKTNDRIIINRSGYYFVSGQFSFSGSANAVIEGALYVDSTRQDSVRFRRKLGATGDVGSASLFGTILITGTGQTLSFWAKADTGTPNFKLEAAQIQLYGITPH